MTANKLILFSILLLCQLVCAQQDSIVKLKEVLISDYSLQHFSNSLSVQKLSDSIIEKNGSSLTALLLNNSVIHFKQNGYGMVSSPSFRGTTAQQTAVVWNGININSQFNGQTDFNTVTTRDYENVVIRSGGGSLLYGSSAIGGTIHLNNELVFKNQFQNQVHVNYGSFNTLDLNCKSKISNQRTAFNVSISRNSSDNDFEYLNSGGKKNQNGQYYNSSLQISFGHQLSKRHTLKVYSQYYESDRHFSGSLFSESNDKYQDLNTRNLIEWFANFDKLQSSLRVAYLSETYKYYPDYRLISYETSEGETAIAKYSLRYLLNSKLDLNTIFDFTRIKGNGTSIGNNTRDISSGTAVLSYKISDQTSAEGSVRKEITSSYESPMLFSLGFSSKVTDTYQIKLNGSRNFRMPTFNDLFWVSGGNQNLKPESSYQGEIGQEVKLKYFKISATVYYNQISEMLRWIPVDGHWRAENVTNVNTYGAEFLSDFRIRMDSHNVTWNASYGYTRSQNAATNLQMTYVPFHKFTSGWEYSYQKFSIDYQLMYTGHVFTLTDHTAFLNDYMVSNVRCNQSFGKKYSYSIGFQILNIWNKNYESVPNRPLPGRNYVMNINFKF